MDDPRRTLQKVTPDSLTTYLVEVRRKSVPTPTEEIELGRPCTAVELVRLVAGRHGDGLRRLLLDDRGELQPTILMFVNDNQVSREKDITIQDGDEVSFLSPIAGG